MKRVNLPQIKSDMEFIAQNEKVVTLEPICLVELAEVLGGNGETTDMKEEPEESSGNAGGFVCWC